MPVGAQPKTRMLADIDALPQLEQRHEPGEWAGELNAPHYSSHRHDPLLAGRIAMPVSPTEVSMVELA